MPSSATSPLAALHLLVSMLGEDEIASPDAAFHDRLAEAVCRLGSMRRAAVFLTDDVRRRLTAVGAHGVDVDRLRATSSRTAELARRALDDDAVVETADLVCIPMSAGGHPHGVVLAERGDDDGAALSDPEREGLWTLGKVCALAESARAATRQQERARHLGDRLDLARDVHERVVQRLFGVTLALGAPGDLTPPQRERCADELQAATEELRTAIQRPMTRAARETQTTLREELGRLADEHADAHLTVDWAPDAEIPAALEPLAQTVVCEAVRNARKHARPTRIAVAVERDGDAIAVAIVNDGVGPDAPAGAGVGLRLAAFEALEFGAAVDFGRTPPDRWHVRLMLPVPAAPGSVVPA